MSSASLENSTTASWRVEGDTLHLQGLWTLTQMSRRLAKIEHELARLGAGKSWNLDEIEKLDNLGALLIWRSWGRRFPEHLQIREQHRPLFERLAQTQPLHPKHRVLGIFALLDRLGAYIVSILNDLWGLFLLWGNLLQEFFYALGRPAHFPWKEISATIVKTGPDSLPILSLIGFLIGIVITYQSAPTLASYGANIYVISIAGISILREFGPMLAAIIIAGRSGSAFTAQIGAMRVTQELDALQTFGVSPVQRLVLPKVIALAIVMPLLVIWTDLMGLFGALLISDFSLNIGPDFFLRELPVMVPPFNFWLGIIKGVLYGILIAWVSGYHGLRVKADTNSLSRETTNSVVLSITLVIVIDAILAVIFANVGLTPS
ncbi:MlaE family ABC transporter permease [Acidithiobacillus sp. IBUN Pt1247-S3]|uniref:MlaE family ABC transporter permease n=1 Tax=Acidithiobacillus sp. IBUN Pt1247-S3 TaxID=3166642 RepID=UPI0034E52A56